MKQESTDNGLHVISVKIGMLDTVQQGIAPVQTISLVIDRDTVRPAELLSSYPF